jgi:hypothetical protein
MGIPESLMLDSDDPGAFVTGLRFVGDGDIELTMTPLTAGAPPPPPPPPMVCDIDGDRDVDRNDTNLIIAARNTPALPDDPRDVNDDGTINIVDARFCSARCTRPNCGL